MASPAGNQKRLIRRDTFAGDVLSFFLFATFLVLYSE